MNRGPLGPLYRILFQFREYYPVLIIYSVCISVLTLATPISVQSLVNTFSFGPYFQPIFVLSVILLTILMVLGLIQSLQYLLVEYLQRKIYAKVTASIARAYFIGDEKGCAELDNKANRYFDVILIIKKLAFLVTDGIAMALQTVLGLILISLYHPYFMVFSVLILIAIVAPVYFLGLRALQSALDESTEKYRVADHLEDLASHSHKGRPYAEKLTAMNTSIQHFLDKRSSHFKTVFIQNIFYVSLFAILNALLLGLGGYLVISNQLTVGQLVAAEIVVNAILHHFLYAKKYLEAFYDMFAASQKVHIFYEYIDKKKSSADICNLSVDPLYAFSNKSYQKAFASIQSVYNPKNYKKIFQNFTFSILTFCLLLAIIPWQQFSKGSGRVMAYNPNDRIQQITATVGGVVEEWLIQDGQFVKKGDPIVRVVDNDPNYLLRLEVQRDAAVAEFEAAKEASDTGRLNFHRQEQLVKEGLSSAKEFESAKITYKSLRAKEAAAAAQLSKTETDLSRQQQQVITAPRDGLILRILLGSGKTNVKTGDPLVDFVPKSNDNAVELFLDGNDLPLVYEGRKVRIQFEGWPAVQFSGWPSIAVGSFGGIVYAIDPSVAENGTFRVLVKPDPNDNVDWPNQTFLRQGARTIGIVVLDQVSIGYELWRQINGFPKSMPNAPYLQNSKGNK